jgi:hypothetical protein
MATQISITCTRSSCGPRRVRRATPSIGAHLTTLAIAALALLLVFYGERWVLQQLPAAPDELTAATCILDAVNVDAGPANVCTSSVLNDKETL